MIIGEINFEREDVVALRASLVEDRNAAIGAGDWDRSVRCSHIIALMGIFIGENFQE